MTSRNLAFVAAPSAAITEAEPSRPLRVLDLFSGIGGFSLGLEAAGMETVAFCEISPKCRHLLAHHWPEVPAYDDICTLTADRLAADGIGVDVVCGGFPCQDLSYAGKGAGLAGERSGLWREYARLIRELRPAVVVVENVAALLSRGLGDVLGDLAEIGYDAEWDCIRASDVGAPHLRNRLWIVAYARGQQHEGFGDAFRRALTEELLGAYSDAGLSGGAYPQADPQRADADSPGSHRAEVHQLRSPELRNEQVGEPGPLGQDVADAHGERRAERHAPPISGGSNIIDRRAHASWREWFSEPDVGRVAHGVPARVDRLHGLGNAVVPEIPRRLGRAILAAMTHSPNGASPA